MLLSARSPRKKNKESCFPVLFAWWTAVIFCLLCVSSNSDEDTWFPFLKVALPPCVCSVLAREWTLDLLGHSHTPWKSESYAERCSLDKWLELSSLCDVALMRLSHLFLLLVYLEQHLLPPFQGQESILYPSNNFSCFCFVVLFLVSSWVSWNWILPFAIGESWRSAGPSSGSFFPLCRWAFLSLSHLARTPPLQRSVGSVCDTFRDENRSLSLYQECCWN